MPDDRLRLLWVRMCVSVLDVGTHASHNMLRYTHLLVSMSYFCVMFSFCSCCETLEVCDYHPCSLIAAGIVMQVECAVTFSLWLFKLDWNKAEPWCNLSFFFLLTWKVQWWKNTWSTHPSSAAHHSLLLVLTSQWKFESYKEQPISQSFQVFNAVKQLSN